MEKRETLSCSFCGKSQKKVKKLIAGPTVYICDECIDLCNEIIEEEFSETSEFKLEELPKPQEIYTFLDDIPVASCICGTRITRRKSSTTTSSPAACSPWCCSKRGRRWR